MRYPASWEVTDAAEGLPATIEGDSIVLGRKHSRMWRLRARTRRRTGLRSWRAGAECAKARRAVNVAGASGYQVSYRLKTLDGDGGERSGDFAARKRITVCTSPISERRIWMRICWRRIPRNIAMAGGAG